MHTVVRRNLIDTIGITDTIGFMRLPAAELTDEIILGEIPSGCRVADLGCGDGRLLARLRDERNCRVLGVELEESAVIGALAKGLPVVQADLDRELKEIPSDAFDFAVLSQTLQQVRHPRELLEEMLRIAKKAIVVVPNYGHWKVRLEIVFRGRAPVTAALPYTWFDTPNQRFMSLHDFRDLAARLACRITREVPIIKGRAKNRAFAPNLRADSVMYVLERGGPTSSESNESESR